MGGQTWMPVNSPSLITPENNGKFRSRQYQEKLSCGASGGARGIRTLETVTRLHTFQACAFDHSATAPWRCQYTGGRDGCKRQLRLGHGKSGHLSPAGRGKRGPRRGGRRLTDSGSVKDVSAESISNSGNYAPLVRDREQGGRGGRGGNMSEKRQAAPSPPFSKLETLRRRFTRCLVTKTRRPGANFMRKHSLFPTRPCRLSKRPAGLVRYRKQTGRGTGQNPAQNRPKQSEIMVPTPGHEQG